MDFSLPIRSRLSAAKEASGLAMESAQVQLPARKESTIRTLDDMTVSVRLVNPKAKGKGMISKKGIKKNVSAAAMLKKKGKVVKTQIKKTSKKALVPSESLSRRVKGKCNHLAVALHPAHLLAVTTSETREQILANTEREITSIFNNLVHTMTLNSDNDATFINSINDATRILTAPLDAEQVESTRAREMAHVTRTTVMRERVCIYEEHMKAKQEALSGYFTQMQELEHDMKKLGSHVLGPDVTHAGNKIEIVMTDTFIEQMKRATRDDYRALDNWTYKLQEMDDSLMAGLREAEMEFDRDVRNLKANLFESII